MDIWNFPYLIHVKKGAFMKKMRWFGKLCCAFAAVTLASLSLVGCDLEVDDKDNRYEEVGYAATGLSVSGQTTSFVVGSEFSLGNGVVTATYSSGDPATVTDEVVQSGFDSSAVASSQTVTLSYTHGGKTVTTSYDVKITAAVASIALKAGDSLYSFAAGSSYYVYGKSAANMVVTYSDNTTDEVSVSEATFSDVTATSATMTYYGKTATVALTKKTVSELWSLVPVVPVSELTTLGTIETAGTGTVADPYILSSGSAAIDCNAAQSTTTWDSSAKVSWTNPLFGKNATAATISFLVNNATGVSFDSILTFFPNGGSGWGGVAFAENGTAHAQGHGWWDIYLTSDGTGDGTNSIAASTWTRITYVIDGGSITAYVDGTQVATATCSDSGNTASYLNATCDKVAVGVGFNDQLWLAGYVDVKTYLANIKVYSTALTAAQVAAIE